MAFGYVKDGRIYSAKYRSIEGKHFSSEGGDRGFYLDWTLEGDLDRVVVVEGEVDALTLRSLGVKNVVSVPDGAGLGSGSSPALARLCERLRSCRRIVLAGDMDEPGLKLRAELARRFGKARSYVVEWPEGLKDANEVVSRLGAEAALRCLDNATPMPVEGLVEALAYEARLNDLYEGLLAQGLDVGLGSDVHKLYSVPFGFMTLITGWPNDGKSQMLDNILVHLAKKHGLKAAIWSPENNPEIHISKLIEINAGVPFFGQGRDRIPKDAIKGNLDWVNEHFYFLVDNDEVEASIESILDRIEAAVQRYGVRVAVIDPYNHIAKPDGTENEVEWIRKLLIRIKRFAQSHELHLFLIAHPRQLPSGSKRFPPTGFHIAGGAPWNAITDFGITVYRPRTEADHWESGAYEPDNEVEFIAWKVRHKWHGARGVAKLVFDPSCGRYYQGIPQAAPVAGHWGRKWSSGDDDI